MMPGHMPNGAPFHHARKQIEHPYHHYHYAPPPPTHSPVYHPYAPYHHMPHYGPQHAYPHQMPHMQQWSPYQSQSQSQPQPQPQPQLPLPSQPQYNMPPRHFQPHASPVVVSSHPPIAHSHTPPLHRIQTPTPTQTSPRTRTPHRIQTPNRALSSPAPSLHSQPHTHSPTQPHTHSPTQPHSHSPTPPAHADVTTPPPQPTASTPFYPPLPWLSVPDAHFPPRAAGRRRKRGTVSPQEQGLALPSRHHNAHHHTTAAAELESAGEPDDSQASTIAAPSDPDLDTPSTSHPPSEMDLPAVHQPAANTTAPPPKHARNTTKPAVPLIPITPKSAENTPKPAEDAPKPVEETSRPAEETSKPVEETSKPAEETPKPAQDTPKPAENTPKPTAPPKSWAELLRAKNAAAAPQAQPQPLHAPTNGLASTNGPVPAKTNSLADVLASYSVDADKKLSFIEPRGLVNTGNLCYMNSVLQVLLFCPPFYDFLDQTAKRAVHSFKSDTPLVDAMIMFLRDFKVIDSATSVDQLRLRLKTDELEQYGDPLTPDYVYDTIRRLPRFDNMKRGSQEDAEEFLGFLLAGLHDDCALVIKKGEANSAAPKTERSNSADGGWLEVTAKQKTSLTQSSGAVEVETPITKIFGGKLRSEYKKAGEKPSVTFEPYQPLQLDIGEPHINNISDALKNLTRLETLDSAVRGAKASTKQVHIETLPPVLILHLKRFHYDEKGPQKIWKKIGYPLELEIPKDVFPQHKRGGFQAKGGFPKYRLTGVVYHHGKNASGGHYTVDLRRQEGKEWIRMDDTIIRRIRAEDVAEGGAEEDPKLLAAALEQHKNDAGKSNNFFAQIDNDNEASDSGGWNQVNGTDKKDPKKWAGVVNGTATPNSAGKRTPLPKESVRDNKVAYILFYQRIES